MNIIYGSPFLTVLNFFFWIGHSKKYLLDAHIPSGWRLGRGRKGLYDTINNLIHFQLGLTLASLGVITFR
ncbi:putative photosystem I [Helianthus anomalus]